ncbi:hypothetical protein Taro_056390 [Colocasia esculenta]|uniref:Uncharacterized protein n=1 Tax=Colocasia esculenta TaxID=4460 RepID=A0A843XVL5_COLES|nr:hypothetical protein [Colocasia esculenta]
MRGASTGGEDGIADAAVAEGWRGGSAALASRRREAAMANRAPEMIREDPVKVSSPGVSLPHCACHHPTKPSQTRFFLTDG